MKQYTPENIIHYYFKKINDEIDHMKDGFEEGSIHLFRVDVKKLRAFLRMLREEFIDENILKLPHQFKKMYIVAGKIRDRQLYIKRLQKNDSISVNLQKKISVLQKEIRRLQKGGDEFPGKGKLLEMQREIIRNLPRTLHETAIKKYLEKKLDSIHEIIHKGEFRDEDLHSIRKGIKDIIYLTKIFRDDFKIGSPFVLLDNNELERAEKLSHTLGLFNDACIAISYLEKERIRGSDSSEDDNDLSRLRQQWQKQKEEQKAHALNELRSTEFMIANFNERIGSLK